MVRRFIVLCVVAFAACSSPPSEPVRPATNRSPSDSQHAGITSPHGDHSPHHGGMVLMQGELHYEVVLDPSGKHSVWFSDAVREDLPASVASQVEMIVTRPKAEDERLSLAIDDSGESWVARGKAVVGPDVMVKLTFTARGEPFEIEIPFVRTP